jgi:hypothetical protein
VLHDAGLDVLEAHAETDDVHDVDVFLVRPRAGDSNFDDEKLEEISHHLVEALGDNSGNAQVLFEPVETEKDFSKDGVLEIDVVGEHHPDILHEILDWLTHPDQNLEILKAHTETRSRKVDGVDKKFEVDKFYARKLDSRPITSLFRKRVRVNLESILQHSEAHGEVSHLFCLASVGL